MSDASTENQPAKRRKSRGWMWYFLILVLLCVAAITTIIVYNFSQQLTLSQLEKAHKLWEQNGPRDYEIRYAKLFGRQKRSDRMYVRVHGGKVTYATLNDAPLPSEKIKYYDVEGLFHDMREFLEKDDRYSVFIRAIFDKEDGHPKWFVRRAMWKNERIEIRVQEFNPLDKK